MNPLSKVVVAAVCMLLPPLALAAPPEPPRRYLTDPANKRPLSKAVLVRDTLYVSGVLGFDKAGQLPADPKVEIKLDFIKPFEGHNITEFTLAPQGDTTEVNWVMSGPAPFISKLMGVFMNMDKMIGKDFETGLANMKAAVEK